MYKTEFNGKQYVFSDDRLYVNGIPIPYSEMSNVAHRNGDVPAFLFNFKGKRFALSYHPEEMKSILPYFLQAEKTVAAPEPVIPEPYAAPEPETPAPYAAPEPVIPEPYAAPGSVTSGPYVAEPEITEPYIIDEPEIAESYDAEVPYDVEEPYAVDEPYDVEEPYGITESEEIDSYDMSDSEALIPITSAESAAAAALAAEQEKRFLTKGKLIVGIVGVVIVAVIIIFACVHKGSDSDAQDAEAIQDAVAAQNAEAIQDEDAASDEDSEPLPNSNDTVEATDGFVVTDYDGTVNAKLKKVYVGDDALKKLSDMGENPKNYQEEGDASYQTVVYEYEVKPTNGMLIGDPITGEPYLSDRKTELEDYWSYDLEANADKDLTLGELEIKEGNTVTVYCVYGMPADLKDYYELVYVDTDDKTIWVHYVLK